MDLLGSVFSFEIAGNSIWRIIALLGVILISLLLGKIFKNLFKKSAVRFEENQRFVIVTTFNALSRSVVFLFAAFGISFGLMFLELQAKVAEVAETVSAILLSVGVGYMLYWLVEVPSVGLARMAAKAKGEMDDMLVSIIRKSMRVTIVILVLIQIAQILSDKPITSVIAGLGIGGLAIALAAQDTVKNFFGSIVLFVDKPFEMGDRIIVDGHEGLVEDLGLRSTRIRTPDGHLLTVPNGELANKTIQNIEKRPYIKRMTNITITYDTPPEKVDRALEILRELLADHEGMNAEFPPRVYFNDLNSVSLNILVIYWYHPPEYWDFMDFTERFNKEVFRRFNAEGIEFAFPTQTMYMAGDPKRPLTVGIRNDNS